MRIVSGELKGRTLKGLGSLEIRPTSERVREAIFSAIGSRRALDNLRVLDLFAGSGALGIEALSRGAKSCTFVEKDKKVAGALKANLEAFGVSSNCILENMPVASFLKHKQASYDLVFADPPYGSVVEKDLVELLINAGVFAAGTLFIFEDASSSNQESYGSLKVLSRKAYGDTFVSMMEYAN
ncbi:MAG: 16S rRNA (guanine(966)-N(2))-methyltransferase RsmD [Rickettsiales bacterium]